MQLDPQAVVAFEAIDAEAIREQVKAVLGKAKVSAAEAGRRCGWTQPYMARRMAGTVAFSAADLVAIAEAVGVAPTQLLPTGPTLTTSAK